LKTHRAEQWFIRVLFLCVLLTLTSALAGAQGLGTGGVNVLTWQNDTPSMCPGCAYRTGQNLNETTITYNLITPNTFGQLCSVQLDGQVYSQPLTVYNVIINTIRYDRVVYVVTQNDTLYAVNGTPQNGNNTCQVLASLPFLTTVRLPTYGHQAVDCHHIGAGGCVTIDPTVGILGTPVINISGTTGRIYLVTETQRGTYPNLTYYHYLYSVDVQTLTATDWVQICASGCGNYASSEFSHDHIQRPGLLFANCGSSCGNLDYIYVAFSMMDGTGWPYPNGAVFGYYAANLSGGTVYYFQTSNGKGDQVSYGGGIWQGGGAPTRAMPQRVRALLRNLPAQESAVVVNHSVVRFPAGAVAGCDARPNMIPVSTSIGRRSRRYGLNFHCLKASVIVFA
jgi:hypothetical protein